MGTGFEYVQTKLQVQTHSELKLLNDRFFYLLKAILLMYMCTFFSANPWNGW